MNAFLTGSRVYGTPREDSDLDICVVVDELDFLTLAQFSDENAGSNGASLRFGKLNVIALSPSEFEAWRDGTDILIARKPVTKQEAIKVIEECKAAKKRERVV